MSEANKAANVFAKRHVELKEIEVEKKDRIKDLHPTIIHMLKMASANDCDCSGEHGEGLKSFFNSISHGAADIHFHHLMDHKGFSDVFFSKGMTISLWSGHFTGANPSVPGAFSPFSFLEMNPLSNNQCNQLLIFSLVLNSKGDLSKSLDKITSSCKAKVTVPTNYHRFLYQLKAYTAAIKIILGDDSIVSIHLANLSQSIKNIPIPTSW